MDWTSLAVLIGAAAVIGVALQGVDSGLEESLAYGREFLALGPHKSAWYSAGDSLFGLGAHSEMGSGEPPLTVAVYAGALRRCELAESAVIAAEVRLGGQGGPWEVRWLPENDLGESAGCVAEVLSLLPFDQEVPMHRQGVVLMRLYARDLGA